MLTIEEELILIETEAESRDVDAVELLELIRKKLSEKNDLGEYAEHLQKIICSFRLHRENITK